MEFVQFHPTDIWPPVSWGFWSPRVRGEGGVLLNKEGKRFMFADILPTINHKPLTTLRKDGAIRRATRTPGARPSFSPAIGALHRG